MINDQISYLLHTIGSKEGLTLKITAVQEALKAASAVPPKPSHPRNGGTAATAFIASSSTNNGSAVKSTEADVKEAVTALAQTASTPRPPSSHLPATPLAASAPLPVQVLLSGFDRNMYKLVPKVENAT